jgi:hypothetical protein
MKTHEIADLITAALKEHRAARDSLAEALVTMMEPLPNGATIKTASHTVEKRKVYCGCSQWSNRSWDVTGSADAYIVDGALIRDEHPSVWDGHNHHHRRTPLYLSRDSEGRALKLASAKVLRSLARELPDALAAYVAGKQADTVETRAAQAALAQS